MLGLKWPAQNCWSTTSFTIHTHEQCAQTTQALNLWKFICMLCLLCPSVQFFVVVISGNFMCIIFDLDDIYANQPFSVVIFCLLPLSIPSIHCMNSKIICQLSEMYFIDRTNGWVDTQNKNGRKLVVVSVQYSSIQLWQTENQIGDNIKHFQM